MDGNYIKDTDVVEKEGEEKQERITNFPFSRPAQTLYGPFYGNQLKILHENENLPPYQIIQNQLK